VDLLPVVTNLLPVGSDILSRGIVVLPEGEILLLVFVDDSPVFRARVTLITDILVCGIYVLPVLADVGPIPRDLLLVCTLVARIISHVLPVSMDILTVPDILRPVRKIGLLVGPDGLAVPEDRTEDVDVVPPVLVYLLIISINVLREVSVFVPKPNDAFDRTKRIKGRRTCHGYVVCRRYGCYLCGVIRTGGKHQCDEEHGTDAGNQECSGIHRFIISGFMVGQGPL
jgi:hypothetical protein